MIIQTSTSVDLIRSTSQLSFTIAPISPLVYGLDNAPKENGTKSNLGSSQGEKSFFPTVTILADCYNLQTQCRIFSLNFNPQRLRLGNKVLRQRLRGPTLAAWYPKKDVSFRDLQTKYKRLGLTTFDEAEDDRQEAIQM